MRGRAERVITTAVIALSDAEVNALLRSLGFPVEPGDVSEITHRLNAFIAALEPLAALDLERATPPAAPLDLDPHER
jgi:hypothetical protein